MKIISRLIAAGAACVLATPAQALPCSMSQFEPWTGAQVTNLIVTATARMEPATAGGHTMFPIDYRKREPITVPEEQIYGQVLTIDRIAGWAADSIARIAAAHDGEIVVVHWSTREDCRPVPPYGTEPGLTPAARYFVTAGLRPRDGWVGGRPTLDVSARDAWSGPYQLEGEPIREPHITLEQLLDLHGRLPLFDDFERDPEAALAILTTWIAANPGTDRSEPVREMLRMTYSFADDRRTSRIDPPMAGTYRLTVTPRGGSPRELMVRTMGRPSVWSLRTAEGLDDVPQPANGYTMKVAAEAAGFACGPGDLNVLTEPTGGVGAEVWTAELGEWLLRECFAGDAAIISALEAMEAELERREWKKVVSGAFRRTPLGIIRFEQEARVSEDVVLRIEGERTSTESAP